MVKIKSIITIMLLVGLFLSGCSMMNDPLVVFKANEQVSSFLDKYPNADITVVKLTSDEVETENAFVKTICGIELENKDYYKVSMKDTESNLEVYGYVDLEKEELVCLKKMGSENDETQSQSDTVQSTNSNKKEQNNNKNSNTNKNSVSSSNGKSSSQSECDSIVNSLEAKISGENIVVKWSPYNCNNFQGYKVVRSSSAEWPKYPENGYLEYITNRAQTTYNDKIQSKINYYSITVLLTDGSKIYLNPVKVVVDTYTESTSIAPVDSDVIYDNNSSDSNNVTNGPSLRYVLNNDGKLTLYWTKYEGDAFMGYKVVWSKDNANLKYPEDGYMTYITNVDTTQYVVPSDKFVVGKNFYRITTLLNGFYDNHNESKRHNSNVIKIEKISNNNSGSDTEYANNLEYNIDNSGQLILTWNVYNKSDFQGYKVVWSQTNPDLKYPDDGYLSYITNKYTTTYSVPESKFLDGINYYRITTLISGDKLNGNVLQITKGGEINDTPAPNCIDSDGGNDVYVKGIITGDVTNGETIEDYCLTSSTSSLIEYYCANDGEVLMNQNVKCPVKCFNGACLKEDSVFKCADPDGDDFYVKGTTTATNTLNNETDIKVDVCNKDAVTEYLCNDQNLIVSSTYYCENGCIDGACQELVVGE